MREAPRVSAGVTPEGRSRPDRLALHLESVAWLCVQHPESRARDLLAQAATRGRLDAHALSALARTAANDMTGAPLPVRIDSQALSWFALASAALVGTGPSIEDVCNQLLVAHRASKGRGLASRFRDLWLDALFLSGSTDAYPYPREPGEPGGAQWRVRVDELNPYLGRAAASDSHREWLAALSEPFTDHDLAPVELTSGSGPPLQRLVAQASPLTDNDLPLVSVVMPVYEPGPDLRFSLASILAQTWPHIEVLLCDDGSGRSTQRMLTQLAATDSRVRVLRSRVNHGAYAARNRGLAAARGEYVTFQDADDWSHPDRVRVQAEPLLRDAALLATASMMVRVDDQLALTVLGHPAKGANASSVLFRREPVLSRLGGFDSVRRAADNEFLGRLRASFGPAALYRVPEVLALVQRTAGSLSRDDMRLLYRDPAREHYRFCYRQWHSTIRDGAAAPTIRPPQRPPVPARPRVAGGRPVRAHRADVTLLGGWSPSSPTSPHIASEITALGGTDNTVALVAFPSPTDLTVPAKHPQDDVVEMIRTGAVRWVLPDERVRSSLAIIRDPAAVPYLQVLLQGVSARSLLLVAGEDPSGRYVPAEVEAALAEAGYRPAALRWQPATDAIAATLAKDIPTARVLTPNLWGAVPPPDVDSWNRAPRSLVGLLPVSPKTSRSALERWADTCLPQDSRTRLFSRTGGPRLAERLGRPVDSLRGTGTSQEEFLDEVAYVAVPPVPGRGPHLHPEVVAAMARGCVAFLDPGYRPYFGAAALYPDERSVDEWITWHHERPETYAAQQDRAATFLRTELGRESLQRTVGDAVKSARQGPGRAARPWRRWPDIGAGHPRWRS